MVEGFLFGIAGGTLPFNSPKLPLSDSSALSTSQNFPSLFPDQGYLLPASLHGGGLVRIAVSNWEALGSLTYLRPGRLKLLEGATFFPAPQISLAAQWDHGRAGIGHQLKWKITFFGDETNARGVTAHQEGALWQLQYRLAGVGKSDAWDVGFGAALRTVDKNRKILIAVDPEAAAFNDNIQRMHVDQAWRLGKGQAPPLILGSRSGFLWSAEPLEVGYEQEISLSYRFLTRRNWQSEFQSRFRYLHWEGLDRYGIGGNLSFVLRHGD
jgi:hypothetical protein